MTIPLRWVLLPDIDEELLVRVAERLRTMIAHSAVMSAQGPLAVTASFGVTRVGTGDTCASAMARADALLYQSKRSGRHRVTHDVDDPDGPFRGPVVSGYWKTKAAGSDASEKLRARTKRQR